MTARGGPPRRRAALAAAWLVIALLGALGLARWGEGLLPYRQAPVLVVEAPAPGRPGHDLLKRVTPILEQRLRALDGVAAVVSRTQDGGVRMEIASEPGGDLDRLRLAAREVLDGAGDLGLENLVLRVTAGESLPSLEVAVVDAGGDRAADGAGAKAVAGERAAFVSQVLVPELAALPGVERIQVYGLATPRAVVTPLAAALAGRGLAAADVAARLRQMGLATLAGQARDGAGTHPLVVRETVSSLAQLAAISLDAPGGPVALRDVARVEASAIGDGTWFRRDGHEGTLLRIFRAPGADDAALSRAAHRRLADVTGRTPDGLRLCWVTDGGQQAWQGLLLLCAVAAAGLLAAVAPLRWVLGRWRHAAALAAGVPAVLLTTSGLLLAAGATPDLLALIALCGTAGLLLLGPVTATAAPLPAQAAAPPVSGGGELARHRILPPAAGDLAIANVAAAVVLAAGALAAGRLGIVACALTAATAWVLSTASTSSTSARLAWRAGGAGTAPGDRGGRRLDLAAAPVPYLRLLSRCLARPRLALAGVAAAATLLAAGGVLLAHGRPGGAADSAAGLDLSFTLPANLPADAAAAHGRALDDAVRAAVADLGGAVTSRSAPVARQLRRTGDAVGAIDGDATGGGLGDANDDADGDGDDSGPGGDDGGAGGGAIRIDLPTGAAARQARDRLQQLLARRSDLSDAHLAPAPSDLDRRDGPLAVYAGGAAPAARDRLAQQVAGLCGNPAPAAVLATQMQLTWRPAPLAAIAGTAADLDRQVAAALGGSDLGHLDIPGLAPQVHLAAETPADLAALPIRLAAAPNGEPAAGQASDDTASQPRPPLTEDAASPARPPMAAGIVPLEALAVLSLQPAPRPVWRLDGNAAVRLPCAGTIAATLGRLQVPPGAQLYVPGTALPPAAVAGRFVVALGAGLLAAAAGLFLRRGATPAAAATLAALAATIAPLACATAAALAWPGPSRLPAAVGWVVIGALGLRPALLFVRRAERELRHPAASNSSDASNPSDARYAGDTSAVMTTATAATPATAAATPATATAVTAATAATAATTAATTATAANTAIAPTAAATASPATAAATAAGELFRPLIASCLLALPALAGLLVLRSPVGDLARPFAGVVLCGGAGMLLGGLFAAPVLWTLLRAEPPAQ